MSLDMNDNGVKELMQQPTKGSTSRRPGWTQHNLQAPDEMHREGEADAAAPFALTPPPAMKARAGKPYVWVTWIAGLLAGEASCEWAAWVRAHFDIEKRARDGDLSTWKAAHGRQLTTRVATLVAEGWTVKVEDQNSLKVIGDRGILAGKPDILAIHPAHDYGLVVDEKTGRRKDADFWQTLIYMLFVPQALRAYAGLVFRGRVNYKDGPPLELKPSDLSKANVQAIYAMCRRVMDDTPAVKVPSPRECGRCDVRPDDCPENLVGGANDVGSTDEF